MDSAWVAAIFGLTGSLVGVAGGVVTTLLTLNRQEQRSDADWARQQRREIYAKYSGVLNAVYYVVSYDDQYNLRMGTEATQAMEAAEKVFDIDPAFDLFASTDMRHVHSRMVKAYDKWTTADISYRPLTDEEIQADPKLPTGGEIVVQHRDYFAHHAEVEVAGNEVEKLVDKAFQTMREELGTSY